MSIADIMRLGLGDLTPQQAADMALAEHREARLARQRGLEAEAEERMAEALALAEFSERER